MEIAGVDVLEDRQDLLQVVSDLSARDLAGIQHLLPEVEQALQALAVAERKDRRLRPPPVALVGLEVFDDHLRHLFPDVRDGRQQDLPGQPVVRVPQQLEEADEELDVLQVGELHSSLAREGEGCPDQLLLQRSGDRADPEEHGYLRKGNLLLGHQALDLLDNPAGFVALLVENGPLGLNLAAGSAAYQRLVKGPGTGCVDGVHVGDHRRAAPVVLVQHDDVRPGKVAGKSSYLFDLRPLERVDRLGVVPHHGQAGVGGDQLLYD